jgi:hypothetical protein
MKYKVLEGTPLYQILSNVQKKMENAANLSKAIVKEVGAEDYARASHKIAGGIRAFKFKECICKNSEKPGWKKMESGCTFWLMPLAKEKSNKDLLKRIDALPTIGIEQINLPLNFNGGAVSSDGGIAWVSTPAVVFPDKKQKIFLIEIHPEFKDYKPVDGMIEILESEFNKLKDNVK